MTGVVGRAGWGLGDQAFSSLTNFALGIVVARAVGPVDFGSFSLAFATYLMAVGVARAIASQPMVIRYSASSPEHWRRGAGRAGGAALTVGLAGGVLCLAVAAAGSGAFAHAFFILALMLPGLLLQDTIRYVFLAEGRPRRAFANDAVWAAVLAPLLTVIVWVETTTVLLPMLAWGGSAAVAAAYGVWQSHTWPRLFETLTWWREHADLAPRYVGEFGSQSGARQVGLFGIGAIGDLGAAGAFRAGEVLLGPLKTLFMGVHLVALPEAARLLEVAPRKLRRAVVLVSCGLVVVAALGGGLLLALPDAIGTALLRDTWQPARMVLLPLAIALAGTGAYAGALIGLRALAAARRSLRARLVLSALVVAGQVSGVVLGGARGAAWGLAVATWCGVFLWWLQFHRGFREHLHGRRPDRSRSPRPDEPETGERRGS